MILVPLSLCGCFRTAKNVTIYLSFSIIYHSWLYNCGIKYSLGFVHTVCSLYCGDWLVTRCVIALLFVLYLIIYLVLHIPLEVAC